MQVHVYVRLYVRVYVDCRVAARVYVYIVGIKRSIFEQLIETNKSNKCFRREHMSILKNKKYDKLCCFTQTPNK